jgi:hypothetical protein
VDNTNKLTKLTDEELTEKISKLNRIVFSNNGNLARQAYPILQQLIEQQNIRAAKIFEQHLANSGVNMNEIINIG